MSWAGPTITPPLYVSPRYGNDEAKLHDRGIWGSISTWQGEQGQRWLVMSMMGPPSKDCAAVQIFIRRREGWQHYGVPGGNGYRQRNANDYADLDLAGNAHSQSAGDRQWSCIRASDRERRHRIRGSPKPGVTIGTNAILYALDAQTGKELYSSKEAIDSWAHFSEPVVVGDNVYVCTWDGKVYAFGLKK